jgi:hypothetical protein
VDDYLALCAERGQEPEKSYSGKFVVRVKLDLHRLLAVKAEVAGMSLNGLLAKLLAETLPATPSRCAAEPPPELVHRPRAKAARRGPADKGRCRHQGLSPAGPRHAACGGSARAQGPSRAG